MVQSPDHNLILLRIPITIVRGVNIGALAPVAADKAIIDATITQLMVLQLQFKLGRIRFMTVTIKVSP